MKLYYSSGACSLAPHIVLEELGIPYTAQQVSFDKGDTETPDFIKLNPMGSVPVLSLQDGTVITEGVAIMQYIADQKPTANLAPRAGTFERTKLQQYMNFIATELHKGFSPIWSPERYVSGEKEQKELVANCTNMLHERLAIFNNWINGKTYLFGDTFTIADAYAFTVIGWCKYTNIKLDRYSNIPGYLNRVAERPAVLRTLKNEGLIK